MSNQSSMDQFLHPSPGTHIVLVDIRHRMSDARTDVTPGRMMVGERPVNQIKVEVIDLKIAEGLFTSGDNVVLAVFVVP